MARSVPFTQFKVNPHLSVDIKRKCFNGLGVLEGIEGLLRFSFNGMERDDEISGKGNLNTTEFREIDTRLGGRWWSLDRIVKSWESQYAGFANNPIYFSDPSGLDPTGETKTTPSASPNSGPIGPPDNPIIAWEVNLNDVVISPDGSDPEPLPSGSRTSDVAKGGAANKSVNRYYLNKAEGTTVFGIDKKNARIKPNGKVINDWVIRFDKPHGRMKQPHINFNERLGLSNPHTTINSNTLKALEGLNTGLKAFNKVAVPVTMVIDAKRIYDVVEKAQGNVMNKTVVVTASDVAGGWAGGFAGAVVGSKAGAWAGGAIGALFGGVGAVPGAAIGGFIGGLAGGIGGALGGSTFGGSTAEKYYIE